VNGREGEFSLLVQSQLILDLPRAFVLGTQSEDRCSIALRNLLVWTSVWTAALGLETGFAGFLIAA
jgi:hypothetical protein